MQRIPLADQTVLTTNRRLVGDHRQSFADHRKPPKTTQKKLVVGGRREVVDVILWQLVGDHRQTFADLWQPPATTPKKVVVRDRRLVVAIVWLWLKEAFWEPFSPRVLNTGQKGFQVALFSKSVSLNKTNPYLFIFFFFFFYRAICLSYHVNQARFLVCLFRSIDCYSSLLARRDLFFDQTGGRVSEYPLHLGRGLALSRHRRQSPEQLLERPASFRGRIRQERHESNLLQQDCGGGGPLWVLIPTRAVLHREKGPQVPYWYGILHRHVLFGILS